MIGYIGLSHLGIVSSITAAAKGFEIIGFDPRKELVEDLQKKKLPLFEKGLQELLTEHSNRIQFTAKAEDLSRCDLVYVSMDVPTDSENRSNLQAIETLLWDVAPSLRKGTSLVILCQVPPGFVRPMYSRLKENGINVFYQVETLIFGQAVERALKPERYIVGSADPSVELPETFGKFLRSFDCPICHMRFESAELTKIAINLYLTSTVTVTNTLAELCEKTGANWSEMVPALKLDRRIGPYAYLGPGLGIAGGNLERDLVTVQNLARSSDSEAGVVDAWLKNSQYRKEWPYRTLKDAEKVHGTFQNLGIWGLAYKVGTHSLKNAPSLLFLDRVKDRKVQAYDPVAVLPEAYASERCKQVADPLVALEKADALVIITPYEEFKKLDPSQVAKNFKGKVIFDPFRVLDQMAYEKEGFVIYTLGLKAKS